MESSARIPLSCVDSAECRERCPRKSGAESTKWPPTLAACERGIEHASGGEERGHTEGLTARRGTSDTRGEATARLTDWRLHAPVQPLDLMDGKCRGRGASVDEREKV